MDSSEGVLCPQCSNQVYDLGGEGTKVAGIVL